MFRQAFGHGARIKITSARCCNRPLHSYECGVPNERLKLMRRKLGRSLDLIGTALKFLQKNLPKARRFWNHSGDKHGGRSPEIFRESFG
jgi:hypothetical protein